MIYHITTESEWLHAKTIGAYKPSAFDREGFIHTSEAHQVLGVAHRYYQGQRDLVILCIDEHRVAAEIKREPATNNELFPHIYGLLNVDAVVSIVSFPLQADGTFELPSEIER